MLKEHAYWALAQYDCSETRKKLQLRVANETSEGVARISVSFAIPLI